MLVPVAPELLLRKMYVSGHQELWPVSMTTFGLDLLTERPLKPKKMLPEPRGMQSFVTGVMLVQAPVPVLYVYTSPFSSSYGPAFSPYVTYIVPVVGSMAALVGMIPSPPQSAVGWFERGNSGNIVVSPYYFFTISFLPLEATPTWILLPKRFVNI